jgi:hypothetical protein
MVARFKRLDRLEARIKKLEGDPAPTHQEEDDD